MQQLPGTIGLGKCRLFYEEQRTPARSGGGGYYLQQRAIVRLNAELARIERCDDYTVLCDEAEFRRQAGSRPSPLQYFIASIGFCLLSQLSCKAARLDVAVDDAEIELRMTYDLTGRFRLSALAEAATGLHYRLTLVTPAPLEAALRLIHLTDKSCHTLNSMRKRVPASGTLVLNGREFSIGD